MHLVLIKSLHVNSVLRHPLSLSLLKKASQLRKYFHTKFPFFGAVVSANRHKHKLAHSADNGFVYVVYFHYKAISSLPHNPKKLMKERITSSSRVITCCYLLKSSIAYLRLPIFVFKGLCEGISQLPISMGSSTPVSAESTMLFPSHTSDFRRSGFMISPRLSLHCSATSFSRVLCCEDLQKQIKKKIRQYLGSHWAMIAAYHSNQNYLNISLSFCFCILCCLYLKTLQVRDFLLLPVPIAPTTNRTLIYHPVSYMPSQCKEINIIMKHHKRSRDLIQAGQIHTTLI